MSYKARPLQRLSTGLCTTLLLIFGIGCKSPLATNAEARDAVVALKKLQAKTETGIVYAEYTSALGDANYAVKAYLETDQAKTTKDFSVSLQDSIKWYQAASEIWSKSLGEYNIGRTSETCATPFHSTNTLCADYPELILPVYGLGATKEPGIHYKLAMQEAWQFATYSSDNAQLALQGKPIKDNARLQEVFSSGLREQLSK